MSEKEITQVLICPVGHKVFPIKCPSDEGMTNWLHMQAYGETAYVCLDCDNQDARPYWRYQLREKLV